MAGKRAEAEAFILTNINKIIPGGGNKEIYEKLFASMNDEQFEEFITGLEQGTIRLAIIAPNMTKNALSVKRNLDLAKELGHEFFEQVWMDGKAGSPPYLSQQKYLVVDLPFRRQAQLLVTKISIPEDNRSVDNLTGQPTGPSKGSKISYPEVQILAAMSLDSTLTELLKYRGGDQAGFNAMNDAIGRTGAVSQKAIENVGGKVKATQALSTYLTAMHLSNTL